MINRINKLFTVLVIVALAIYIVILNRTDVTIYLTPGNPISTSAGLVLLGAFAFGILCTTLVAIFFGVKAYFRERRFIGQERERRAFYEGMLKARSYSAAKDFKRAREEWERVIRKDPTDIIARVELSKVYEQSNDLLQALKVIDAARIADPDNIEVLFRAAELNVALQNKTAAIDNLALILYHDKNVRAAKMARDLSEELGRIDDAAEYQARLSGELDPREFEEANRRISFKKVLKECEGDSTKLFERVNAFAKKNGEFAPALEKLGDLYVQSGKADEAAQYYVRAAKVSGSTLLWNQAQRLWVTGKMPDKAIASAKTARNEARGAARVYAEMDLVRVYLTLNMLTEARDLIDQLPRTMKEQGIQNTGEIYTKLLVLKGIYFYRSGDIRESAGLWKEILERELETKSNSNEQPFLLAENGPAPHLSTP